MHLLKENETRGVNPSVYTTPASAFNTIPVDFQADDTLSAAHSTHSLNLVNGSQSNLSLSKADPVHVPASCPGTLNKSLPRNFGGRVKLSSCNRLASGSSQGDVSTEGSVTVMVLSACQIALPTHNCMISFCRVVFIFNYELVCLAWLSFFFSNYSQLYTFIYPLNGFKLPVS